MRNFIVAFMLVILLSSIMFVILRPIKPAQVNNNPQEKSNVEKLLTEPSQAPQEISASQKKEIIDEIMQKLQKNEEIEQYKPQNIQPAEEKKQEKITQNEYKNNSQKHSNRGASSNDPLVILHEELAKKYNNNPNAEISQEDMQKILIQMLEGIQSQQPAN